MAYLQFPCRQRLVDSDFSEKTAACRQACVRLTWTEERCEAGMRGWACADASVMGPCHAWGTGGRWDPLETHKSSEHILFPRSSEIIGNNYVEGEQWHDLPTEQPLPVSYYVNMTRKHGKAKEITKSSISGPGSPGLTENIREGISLPAKLEAFFIACKEE